MRADVRSPTDRSPLARFVSRVLVVAQADLGTSVYELRAKCRPRLDMPAPGPVCTYPLTCRPIGEGDSRLSMRSSSALATTGPLGRVSLVLITTWAAVTSAYGVFDLLNSVDQALRWRDPNGGIPLPFGLGLLLMIGWILSLNLLLPAIVLGIVEIALGRGPVRGRVTQSVAYAMLVSAPPAALMVFSQLRNETDQIPSRVWSLDVFGAVAFPVAAWAVVIAAWMLLRLSPQSGMPMSPAEPQHELAR